MAVEEISPEEDLVNPYRMAKGDLEVAYNLRGRVSRALPAQLTIVKELIRVGRFPYHYEVYGVGFMELRNAFRSPWGTKSSAVLLEQWGIGVSVSRADSIYQVVCKRLGLDNIMVIEYVTEAKERRNVKREADRVGKEKRKDYLLVYKDAFTKLVEIMDEERERLKQELENT